MHFIYLNSSNIVDIFLYLHIPNIFDKFKLFLQLQNELSMYEFDLITANRTQGQLGFLPTTALTYGWGSRKIEDAEKDLSEVSMSKFSMTIRIKIIESSLCEDAIGRKLKLDEMCSIAVEEGNTCAMVIKFYTIFERYKQFIIASILRFFFQMK